METDSVIQLLTTGVFGVGVWAALWHIDRRLIRLETAVGLGKQAAKE